MKKIMSSIIGLFILVVVVGVLVIFFGWSRVPDILASRLSDKLKVQVSIDDIHLTSHTIDIQKLEIGNPRKYTLPRAFSAEQILLSAPLTNYLRDHVIIDHLELDNIYLGLEFDSFGNKNGNWTVLMANLNESSEHSSKQKSVLIKTLILTNIDITLAYRDGSRAPNKLKRIKRLEFHDVTSDKGIPTEEITRIIMREMLKSVFTLENLGNMVEGFLESPQKGIENVLKPLKGLFN